MWLGYHFQGQKVKCQGHQAALIGCSSHHITYLDANSLYATAHSHHLYGAGAYCGGLPHSFFYTVTRMGIENADILFATWGTAIAALH